VHRLRSGGVLVDRVLPADPVVGAIR
jgi:hypothetical protein